jgi:ribosomal protein S18 acetylase RimI-like enzyme
MKIRKATLKDCSLMAEIDTESKDPFHKMIGLTKSRLARRFRELMERKIEFFIYDRFGFVGFKKDFAGYKKCQLFWLVVKKDWQNHGIGRKMAVYLEDYAKKLKFRSIYVYTHPIHKKAINLYKNLGYKKINEFPDYYSNGDKSLLFGKRLK